MNQALARRFWKMLAKFRAAKQAEIAALKRGEKIAPFCGKRLDFASALKRPGRIAAIAEYKRASPSRGPIRSDLEVEEVARQYSEGGAAAMSILTEETYFDGHLAYLLRARQAVGEKLPLLRKDFIFDPIQIDATASAPADAVLLIARLYSGASELRDLRKRAEGYGLAAVVEIFDEKDLDLARQAGAKIIQVNARDLATLKVDFSECLRIARCGKPEPDETWIAASGMDDSTHLAQAQAAGYHAALIGGALMDAASPGDKLKRIIAGLKE